MSTFTSVEAASGEKTLELLWTRVRERGDLPGFSKVVNAVVGAMRGDDDREFNMTKTVLQDPALTQKVLRLANSAMYSVFGQGINTVSKAVIVLGTETIGHLALGLKLIDGLSALSTNTSSARAEMERAVVAGHVARHLASSAGIRDAEEAVVCSMLHSLGQMMAAFYLPEQWEMVQARCAMSGVDENEAAQSIMGVGLDEVGRTAARQWGLPTGLVNSMRDVPPNPLVEPLAHADWLAAISTVSSRCASVICSDNAESSKQLHKLAGDYAEMLGLDASQMLAAVDTAHSVAAKEDSFVVRPAKRGSIEPAMSPVVGKPVDAVAILTRGVADMHEAQQNASTGQLLSMALETVYQGFGFSRAIAFLRNQERSQYVAQLSLGDGVQELLHQLTFGDAYQPDVFHASLANDKMIFVENAKDPAFVNKVPRWWKEALPTVRSFMVLPLTANRRPVGFIYGDWDISKPAARIEQAEILPLNELRTLVTRVLEQRRHDEPSWARKLL